MSLTAEKLDIMNLWTKLKIVLLLTGHSFEYLCEQILPFQQY